jgi:uncharacterized protein YigE (DUF2233 family)
LHRRDFLHFIDSVPGSRSIRILIAFLCVATARAVEFESVTFEGKRHTVVRVDLRREKLELFLNDETGKSFNRFATLDRWLGKQGRQLLFGMNAGMYHPGFAPVGWFVVDGKQKAPLNLEKGAGNFFWMPNGVFAVTANGAQIVESPKAPALKAVQLATQSGPMLVIDGQLHQDFPKNSERRLFRNGVGVKSPQEVIFAISEEPVNFHEFARLFRDRLACQNALFLDGTVSSLHAAALTRSDFRMDLGPLIGITAPKPIKAD